MRHFFGQKQLVTALCVLLTNFTFAQISGTVYRDINANGTRETTNPNEPGEYGVSVKAYNSANVLLATVTTDASGFYNFTSIQVGSGLQVRLEFITDAADFPAKRTTAMYNLLLLVQLQST
jgi:hypothetical protein